ncbi:MAG: TPM domain-containing protein, partial [Gemmataceae bacterium]
MNMFRNLLAGLLLVPGLLLAANIRDEAKLFSPEGVKKAQEKIDDLKKKHKSELFIETFAKAEDLEAAKKENPDRAKYFQKWASERYKELKVEGVYVLVCKEPNYIQVVNGKMMESKGFDNAKRNELVKLMQGKFKEKEFDAGLMAVVNEVGKTLQTKAPVAQKPGTEKAVETLNATAEGLPAWTSWLCIGLMVLMGLWLVVGLIRAFSE